MNFKLNNQGQLVTEFILKSKSLYLTTDYDVNNNTVVREGKFKRPYPESRIEVTISQKIENFSEELQYFLAYLNNAPEVNEMYLYYSLYDRCIFNSLVHGRILDGDLSGYANMLMMIYEVWTGYTLNFEDGFAIRSTMIRKILDELSDKIFITKFVAVNEPYKLVRYDSNLDDLGFLLRIE